VTDSIDKAATLILIDVQQGLDNPWFGQRNNPHAEDNIARLLNSWRTQQWPVAHVQHSSVNPQSPLYRDQPGYQLKQGCGPQEGEQHFVKQVNSAFVDTGLEQYLHSSDTKSLVICGLTAEHCVSTSVRHAANLGFDVVLAEDATASFDCTDHNGNYFGAEQVYSISLATLNEEFCTVRKTNAIIGSVGCA